jgi:Na+/alanine symporter
MAITVAINLVVIVVMRKDVVRLTKEFFDLYVDKDDKVA